MKALEARKHELVAFLAEAEQPPPRLHPEMARVYRERVTELYKALSTPESRMQAGDVLRSLIKAIMLTPAEDGGIEIDVQGDLAGILWIASKAKRPSDVDGLVGEVERVAGYRGVPNSQFEMVAGTRNLLKLVYRGLALHSGRTSLELLRSLVRAAA